MKKYIAVADELEPGSFWAEGNTPEEAYRNFIESGEASMHASYQQILHGSEISVYIYTWVAPEDSPYQEDEIDPDWLFVLDRCVAEFDYTIPMEDDE